MPTPTRGRVVALSSVVLGGLVLALTLYLLRSPLRDWIDEQADRSQDLSKFSRDPRQRVHVSAGEIEVADFLRFLGDYTGLPVIYDANDKRITGAKITIAAPMEDVDANVVKAVLEANGFRVRLDSISGGRHVLRIEARSR